MNNLDLLENDLQEATEENEAKTQRNVTVRIDLRATKESAQKLGIASPKRWQFTIPVWKDAGAIKRFQNWISKIDVFFKDRNEKDIYVQALWLGVQSLVTDTEKYKEYKKAYEEKEYAKIPSGIKQMFDDQLQMNHKRLFNEMNERKDTNWTLYKQLGRTIFIELYQHIEGFDAILAYCENVESCQSSDETLTKTDRIQIRLSELSRENDTMPKGDIAQDMLDRGIIENKDDKTLGYVGSTLGLSGGQRGVWNLGKLKAA